MTASATRRNLLKGAGCLLMGFDWPGAVPAEAAPGLGVAGKGDSGKDAPGKGAAALPGSLKENPKVGSWLRIGADGKVTLLVGKVELGQGVLTAVRQICADELDVDIARIETISGDTFLSPNEGVTAGSFSMPDCGTAVRHVSADARAILLGLAATRLGAQAQSLSVADGTVKSSDGRSVAYWDLLAGQAFDVDATAKAPLKPAADLHYIGHSFPRIDLPPKVSGGPIWIQDLRPAGMLHGRILRPPAYGAKLSDLDLSVAQALPGVMKVVRDGSFVGVIAVREEQALAGVAALRAAAKWDLAANGPSDETIYAWLLAQKSEDTVILDRHNVALAAGLSEVSAEFRRPYQMHASIGPSTAVATLGSDGVMTVQTHSQSVFQTAAAIAMMLGMEPSKVRCQHVQGSGCYGHNAADDAAADAALLARAMPGRPIRVQWTRVDEHQWEPYGSAMLVRTRAKVDAKGDIADWELELWSTSHGTRPGGKAGNLLPAQYLEKPFPLPKPVNGGPPNYAADRNAIAYYEFPGQRVTTHFIPTFAARASSTRGLGAYANVFSVESFIDELARRANVDPLDYRLRYLKDPRARDVLQRAAGVFGWKDWKTSAGRGRGLAFARYKNLAAFTSVALEVEVDRNSGIIRVVRGVAANDVGQAVSPDGVRNQIEGGMIQSLSWSLKERVRFDAGGVKTNDWVSYPILTFSEVPPIRVELVERTDLPFLGTGEAAQGPTAAALANAVQDAIGVRIRELPLTPARVKAALLA